MAGKDEHTLYKGYNLGNDPDFAMIKVKAVGQGKVPNALIGRYTSMGKAKAAVDAYLNSLKKGGRKRGSTKNASTG